MIDHFSTILSASKPTHVASRRIVQVVQDQVGGMAEALPSVAEQTDGVPQQGPKEGHRESAALAAVGGFWVVDGDGSIQVYSGTLKKQTWGIRRWTKAQVSFILRLTETSLPRQKEAKKQQALKLAEAKAAAEKAKKEAAEKAEKEAA